MTGFVKNIEKLINSRRTDPISSHLAGVLIEKTGTAEGHRALLRVLVTEIPGLTSAEMTLFCDLDRYQIARRLPEIIEIKKNIIRKCTVCGKECVTWIPKGDL